MVCEPYQETNWVAIREEEYYSESLVATTGDGLPPATQDAWFFLLALLLLSSTALLSDVLAVVSGALGLRQLILCGL